MRAPLRQMPHQHGRQVVPRAQAAQLAEANAHMLIAIAVQASVQKREERIHDQQAGAGLLDAAFQESEVAG